MCPVLLSSATFLACPTARPSTWHTTSCPLPLVAHPQACALTGLRRLLLLGGSASQLEGSDLAGGVGSLARLEALRVEGLAVVPHQVVLRTVRRGAGTTNSSQLQTQLAG